MNRLLLIFVITLILSISTNPVNALGPKKKKDKKASAESVEGNCPACEQCEVCKACDPCLEAPICPEAPVCEASHADVNAVKSELSVATESLKVQTTKVMEADENFNACSKDLRASKLSVTHLEEKLSAVKESLGVELTAKGEKLAEKDTEVKRLSSRITDLNKELADVKKELEEIKPKKGLSGLSKYCNFTLMMEDGEVMYNSTKDKAIKNINVAAEFAREKGEEGAKIMQEVAGDVRGKGAVLIEQGGEFLQQTSEASRVYQGIVLEAVKEGATAAEPYVKMAGFKAQEAYNTSLKPIVNENVMPFYKQHIEEHVETVKTKVSEFYAETKPIAEEFLEVAKVEAANLRLSVASMVSEGSKVTRAKYNSETPGQGIDGVLEVMEVDGEFVIDALLCVLVAYIFYLYAWGLVKFFLKLTILLPLRIAFWPVFFVFGIGIGGKRKEKEVPM